MKKALFCGTFDPFTNGHLDIVNRALQKFDKIIICIGYNSGKNPLFTSSERRKLINKTLVDHPERHRMRIITSDDPVVDVALRYKASVLIRGARPGTDDFQKEIHMAEFNKQLAKIRGFELQTEFIYPEDPLLQAVSSSNVKKLCDLGEYIAVMELVSPVVHQRLMEEYLRKTYERLTLWHESWESFLKYYKSRAYHNLSHIAYMLNMLSIYIRFMEHSEQDVKEVLYGILYHDVIYDIHRTDNEQQSADYAEKQAKIYYPHVRRLILATSHTQTDLSDTEALIADLDLSIFGTSSPKIWESYNQQIRQEYAEYDDKTFINERIKVLESFVNRQRIFQTEFFYDRFEKQAIANLTNEINRLKSLV